MNTMILDNLMVQMDPKGLGAFSPAAKIIVATSVCTGKKEGGDPTKPASWGKGRMMTADEPGITDSR